MPTFQAPRGTADRLPTEQKYWRYIESHATDVARRFGYGRIDSPMFEDARLFVRGVGEGTDIVEKEMYVFEDRGGDHLTLRAEGTAPVCRAYLEHGMHNQAQPVRMYYLCPVFRYERPQAGRFRQHHQFGVEAIGDGDPSVDAEVIELGWTFMHDIGLSDITLLTNSIGDGQCRPEYIAALKSYYQSQTANLCPDCRQRLERNPLRLLDCKVETCRALGEEAPKSVECLCGGVPDPLGPGAFLPGRGRDTQPSGPPPGAGFGLLHAHRVRDPAGGRGSAVHHPRRRALRRAD